MAALGLLLLVAAGVTALDGFLANDGGDHQVTNFDVFGLHFSGSSGLLFLYGAIVGAVGIFGLELLLAGWGRGFRSRVERRRELRSYRGQADSLHAERDELAEQLARERRERERSAVAGVAPSTAPVHAPGSTPAVAPPAAATPTAATPTVPPATVPPATVPPATVPPATVPPAAVPPAAVPPKHHRRWLGSRR